MEEALKDVFDGEHQNGNFFIFNIDIILSKCFKPDFNGPTGHTNGVEDEVSFRDNPIDCPLEESKKNQFKINFLPASFFRQSILLPFYDNFQALQMVK